MIEIVRNKKAYFDYEIVNTYEAGIELEGHEVKSIRAKQVNLKGSYVSLVSGVPLLKGVHISAYKVLANKDSLAVDRDRKLFLHKKDIGYLKEKSKAGGFSVIPLRMYYKGNLIKLEVGLVQGRKKHQKKQLLKERTMDKEAKVKMKKYL